MTQLSDLLRREYGLDVVRLEPARRGWTAHTYVASTPQGQRCFVKMYPKARLPPTALPALPALAELHRMVEVPRPIASTNGAWHVQLGEDEVVVFDYLDAEPVPFTFGGERNGALLAHVHQCTTRAAIVRETFEPWFGDQLWRTVERARAAPANDRLQHGLRQFFDREERGLIEEWARFKDVASACRATAHALVLTHGDWPFNLLEGKDGQRFLVDWDELILAPPERDTWFAQGDTGFWRGYHSIRPNHVESTTAAAYYVGYRYFEELVLFAQDILSDLDVDRRGEALELLNGAWMTGLRHRLQAHHKSSTT